jgi:hypothetical protein
VLEAEDGWPELEAEDNCIELEVKVDCTELEAKDDCTELEAEDGWPELEAEDDCTELEVEVDCTELATEDGWPELELRVDDVRPELVAELVVDRILVELTLEAEDDLIDETEVDALVEVDGRADEVEALIGEHVPKPDWHPLPQYADVVPQ